MSEAFINLTPHTINVGTKAISPSGTIARVSMETRKVGEHDGVPLTISIYGDVVGLPEPRAGVIYIVYGMVKSAVPHRTDVGSPSGVVWGIDINPPSA